MKTTRGAACGFLASSLTVTTFVLVLAAPALGSLGTFDRTWGKDVDNAGVPGFEICVVAPQCQPAAVGSGLGGEMNNPAGVAADAAGNVYVVEGADHRIQKFNSNGDFLLTWGKDVASAGPGNTGTGFEVCVAANGDTCKIGVVGGLGGELSAPSGVATDAAGNVYVSEVGNDRIQKFDSAGVFQRTWGSDVASAGPGNTGTAFEVCAAVNGDTCKSGVGSGSAVSGGEMHNPGGVAADPAGNVYVTDSSHHRIQKFDSAGNFQRTWGTNVVFSGPGNTGTGVEICVAANGDSCQFGLPNELGGEMFFPDALAVDAAGNVYVAESNRVQRFDSAGVFQRTWGANVALSGPGDTGTGFEVCVAANGDTCKRGSSGGLGGVMSAPAGLATQAGDVYVADQGNHRVQKFDSVGNFQRTWGKDVASAGPGNTGTGFEVCVAPNGDTCKIGVVGGLGGEMSTPRSVATDPAGSLYVVEQGNDRLQKFAADPPPTPLVAPPTATPTGQRAAALKKCKKKKGKARAKCKKKANKRPLQR